MANKKIFNPSLEVKEDFMRRYMSKTYDWDFERQVMSKIQKVQRNWDYEKYNIKREKEQNLEELLWVATNTPSKQYEGYYDLFYTDDRKVIEEIYKYTWGNTHRRTPPSTWRTSQANASVLVPIPTVSLVPKPCAEPKLITKLPVVRLPT